MNVRGTPARPWLWLPVLAAALRVASLPGLGLPGWLVFCSVPPRLLYWERGGRAWGDWLGGVVFFAGTFHWLIHVHPAMVAPPALVLGAGWMLEGRIYRLLRRRLPLLLAGPLALVAWDVLRARWPMGGVPWADLGMGIADLPGALFLARAVGEEGVAFLVAAWGAWPLALGRPAGLLRWLPAPLLTAAAALASFAAPPPAGRGEVRCLAVQPCVGLDEKHDPLSASEVLVRNLREGMAAMSAGERPDLLLWAETMFPLPVLVPGSQGELRRRWPGGAVERRDAAEVRAETEEVVAIVARDLPPGGCFLAGAHVYEAVPADAPAGTWSPRSSESLLFTREGRLLDRAAKTRLVPFGEVLPFHGRFPGAEALAARIQDAFGLEPTFRVAPARGPLEVPGAETPWALGSAICWENVFPAVFREQARAGAEAFVVLSNEAWYGLGAEMDQMLAATRFRAAECGRAVLRVTNTGVTVLVDPAGRVGPALERGVPGSLAVDLPRVDPATRTPWLAGGWLVGPVAGLLAWLGAALALLLGGHPRGPALDPSPPRG